MLALKIITILLGAAFAVFGYLIYFREKYHLINGFKADLKAGRKDEAYARRVGMVEWIMGIALLLAGAGLIIFC